MIVAPFLNTQYGYISARIGAHYGTLGTAESEALNYQADRAEAYLRGAGLVGVGPGQPYYLPARDTDMVAVSVGRALGLVGTATLFALYLLIALRGVQIASRVTGPGSLLAIGATTYVCGQAALNLLVAAKILPVTGVPLPFVSYGFNSLISVGMALGLLHAAYRAARVQAGAQAVALVEPAELERPLQRTKRQTKA